MSKTRTVDPRTLQAPAEARIAAKEYAQSVISQRMALRDKYESNGEVQRHRRMTKEERVRQAVTLMTGRVKQFNDFKAGRDTSEAAAEKKAREIASRALGEKV